MNNYRIYEISKQKILFKSETQAKETNQRDFNSAFNIYCLSLFVYWIG